MSKGITIADKYQFRLNGDLKYLAETELRESSATRDFALDALRKWIETNPRISAARLDSNFLLRFLRSKKFSVPMAQAGIERYLLLRQSYSFFNNLDMNLPTMKTLLDNGYIFAVPRRDRFGRRVIITRPGVFDPYEYVNTDMLKIHGMVYETLMEDQENQIRGYVHIVDCSELTLPYITLFTPKEAVRIIKNAENTLPMRHKAIYAINIQATMKFAADFAVGMVTEKLRNRMKFYTASEFAEKIDTDILPLEYGGKMPMVEMIDLWKDEMMNHQRILLNNDKMRVHLHMYSMKAREGAVSALKQLHFNPTESSAYGLQGSFRKLEVD